jgi:hypothetical protein
MTSVSSNGTVAAELIQSRDANTSEALVIMRTQGTAFRRRLAAIRGYRIARFAWLALIVGLFAAFILATKMHWIPRMSAWISVPLMFVVAYGLCRIWSRYHNRVCAEVYQDCLKGDRRFRLEADGLVISGSGITSSIPWSSIWNVVPSKDWLVIYLSPIDSMSLPVATFEGQDVQGFGAELVRRWQAHRAPTGASA